MSTDLELSAAPAANGRAPTGERSSTHLAGRRLLLGRLLAGTLILVTLTLFFISIPLEVSYLSQPCDSANNPTCHNLQIPPANAYDPSFPIERYAVVMTGLNSFFALIFVGVALIIVSRRSDDWMALFVATFLVLFGTATFGNSLLGLVSVFPAFDIPIKVLNALGASSIALFFYLFPDGRFAPRWMRWIAPVAIVREWVNVFAPGAFGSADFPLFVAEIITLLFAQVYRYRRVSSPIQRQQTKWVVFGMVVAVTGFLTAITLGALVLNPGQPGPTTPWGQIIANSLLYGFLSIIPISIGIAALRFRLWEIDVLINRTLVYVPLTAILAGVFAASITLSQKLFLAITGSQSDAAAVASTLIVVAAIEPVKEGLQHLVERRFKEAPDPEKELRFIRAQAETMLAIMDPAESTARLLEAAVRAFDAVGGAVFSSTDGNSPPKQTFGTWEGDAALTVPIAAGDDSSTGKLCLARRRDGSPYTEQDRMKLEETAALVDRVIRLGSSR